MRWQPTLPQDFCDDVRQMSAKHLEMNTNLLAKSEEYQEPMESWSTKKFRWKAETDIRNWQGIWLIEYQNLLNHQRGSGNLDFDLYREYREIKTAKIISFAKRIFLSRCIVLVFYRGRNRSFDWLNGLFFYVLCRRGKWHPRKGSQEKPFDELALHFLSGRFINLFWLDWFIF